MENSTFKSDQKCLDLFRSRVQLKKNNGEWEGLCPFHPDKNPSFKVNNKQGDWLFICFGCGEKGSVIDFVQKLDKCSTKEAMKTVRFFIGDWGKDREAAQIFKPIGEEQKHEPVPVEKYIPLVENLPKTPSAVEYLKSRGISVETATRLKVGYRAVLPGRTEEHWLAIPAIENNQVIGLKYRCISKKDFGFQKGLNRGLFNLEAVDPFRSIFVVEGEIDAMSFEECGMRAVSIGSHGTKLTPEQKDQIMTAEIIYLAGDNDTVGQEAMQRLWADLQERTFLLQWPTGIKDANDLLLNRGKEGFKADIKKLTQLARTTPMPYVKSLQETLANSVRINLADHPNRLRFPWPSVDKMAVLLPGSVMSISATNTKMGKSTVVKDFTLYNAFHGDTVLYYSCELTDEEFGNMVAAGLLKKNRNHLTQQDNQEAAKQLGGIRYYIGRNPTLTTVGPVLDLIEAGVRRLGATIVVLDHIHFICRNNEKGAEITDQANAMQRLKNMAVKYGLKVIVVGQPRKAQQTNRGKVIHITDFKGSESITSDADAIFILHRNEVKVKDLDNPPMDDYDPNMEVHLLGARAKGDGPTFTVLRFFGEYATLVEADRTHPETGQF